MPVRLGLPSWAGGGITGSMLATVTLSLSLGSATEGSLVKAAQKLGHSRILWLLGPYSGLKIPNHGFFLLQP